MREKRRNEREGFNAKASASSFRPLSLSAKNECDQRKKTLSLLLQITDCTPLTDCREEPEVRHHERGHLEVERVLTVFKGKKKRREVKRGFAKKVGCRFSSSLAALERMDRRFTLSLCLFRRLTFFSVRQSISSRVPIGGEWEGIIVE